MVSVLRPIFPFSSLKVNIAMPCYASTPCVPKRGNVTVVVSKWQQQKR